MPNPIKLAVLIELREAAGLTQAEAAGRCGLRGRQSRKTLAAWEMGQSTPRQRFRLPFAVYLLRDLGLGQDLTRFDAVFGILVEEWEWPALEKEELADFIRLAGASPPNSASGPQWHPGSGTAGRERPDLPRFQAISNREPDRQAHSSHPAWEMRLPSPTYDQLFGIERLWEQIAGQLIAPGPPWIVAVEGLGGIGKTALADTTARRLMSADHFADLAWVSAKPNVFEFNGRTRPLDQVVLSVEAAERAIAVQLLGSAAATESLPPAQRRQMLVARLADAPTLVVIDNLESLANVADLLPLLQQLANPTKFLLTSRQRTPGGGTLYHLPMPALGEADALALMRHEATVGNLPHVAGASDDELRPLYAVIGGNPLALRLAVGQLHVRSVAQLIKDWQQAGSSDIENLYAFIYRSAWDVLDEESRQVLLAMPLAVEQGGRAAHLAATAGMAEGQLHAALERLVALNLVHVWGTINDRRFAIHSLTRAFLHKRVADWWH
ncbi:MAG: helix-turn-helix domain-containing protein [Caldilineaceae bacterium]|nr:helix-turn-helix domain-containing protein [Caldilineaceae bacterium]